MFRFFVKHKVVAVIISAVLIAGGYYGYRAANKTQEPTRYVLGAAEKGTLIVSVSGTGQVSVSDQVDVKPKVSGEVVSVNAVKDQKVKEGDVLVQLDARAARAAVTDAEIALESARIKLEDMISPPDALALLQAQNALAQAERNLEKAQDTADNIEADTEEALISAYEDGYSQVSESFYKLSDYMKDLHDVLGTDASEDENVAAYKLILGENSPYIQRLQDDYAEAKRLYDTNYAFFRTVFSDAGRDTIYKLITDTLNTARPVFRALESARHMYDAITVTSYTQYRIASTIDKMQPKIESDTSSVTSVISSLQSTIDKIDTTVKEAPGKIKDAQLSLKSAQEQLADRKQALDDLRAGSDPLDIRTQQNVVAQKEAALRDAREKLANYTVRAPFGGVIADITVKKGDTASGVIATLITEQRIAEISLNEIDAAKVKTGQKATVTFDAVEGLSLSGEVQQIDTLGTVSQGVVTYDVQIGLDMQDDRVKPGMTLSATIIIDVRPDALMVPNAAVKSTGSGYYVEMLDDAVPAASAGTNGSASASFTSAAGPRRQTVEIGVSNDTMTEITSGLKEGDKVIVSTVRSSVTPTTQGSSIFGGMSGGSRPAGGAVMFRRD